MFVQSFNNEKKWDVRTSQKMGTMQKMQPIMHYLELL